MLLTCISETGVRALAALMVTASLIGCPGPICDSVACVVEETVTVTGIPSGGHPWSVTVCTDASNCANGAIDTYQGVVLAGFGDVSATTGQASSDSKIELSISLHGAVVTEGRPVHVTIKDANGGDVTNVDHVVQLATENIGGSDCPVMCPVSHVTKKL